MKKSIVRISMLAGMVMGYATSPVIAAGTGNNSDIAATAPVYTLQPIISQNVTPPPQPPAPSQSGSAGNQQGQGDQNQGQGDQGQGNQQGDRREENQPPQ